MKAETLQYDSQKHPPPFMAMTNWSPHPTSTPPGYHWESTLLEESVRRAVTSNQENPGKKNKPSATNLSNSARQSSLPRTSQDSFLAKIPALTLTAA